MPAPASAPGTAAAPRPPFVLALDQGTTSSRALVFDAGGALVASAQKPHRQFYPQSGWVEHDALEILARQTEAMQEAVAAAGISPADLAAVGITNQRETAVVWERATGRPIHPAIVWQCRRTAPECDALRDRGLAPFLAERTGLVLDAYFSATKIAWILDHVPGARARAERGELLAGTIDSWLLFHLTGGTVHATDPSNASRTMLYDLHECRWSEALCDLFRVPRSVLPEVRPSSGVFGALDASFLGAAVPIAGIAGDQQAALFGQGCFAPGAAKNTYGTGCFLLMNTGRTPVRSRTGLVTTVAWDLGDGPVYALEGSVFNAGSVIQWLRDELHLISAASECDRLAESVPDAGGVHLVPAFTGLGAPYWDMRARGTITGLHRGSGRAHIARAALEGIAFQSDDVLRCMAQDLGAPLAALRVDGGASVSDFLMGFQADLSGVPVDRPACIETTAFGAACLAGLATGVWPDLDALAHVRATARVFLPTLTEERRAALVAGWREAVRRTLSDDRPGRGEAPSP